MGRMPPRTRIDPAVLAELSERLRRWLAYEKAVSQLTDAELATRMRVSQPTITGILNGNKVPGYQVLIALWRYCNIRPDELMQGYPPDVDKIPRPRRKPGRRPSSSPHKNRPPGTPKSDGNGDGNDPPTNPPGAK